MSFTQGHALIIGVGAHARAPQADNPIMVADAEAIASVLHDDQLCAYPGEQVHILTGENATRANILAVLDDLAENTGKDDVVLLFYSGQGARAADGSYRWITHDAALEGDQVAADGGLGEADLLNRLKAIPAGHVLIILNTPLSVAATDHPLVASNVPEDMVDALLATGAGRMVITACRAGQVSHVGNGLLTIFAQALFDGLRGKGMRNDGSAIDALDLYAHVREVVSNTTWAGFHTRQEPELSLHAGDESFVVGLHSGEALREMETARQTLPADAVREVDSSASQHLLEQIMRAGHSGVRADGAGQTVHIAPAGPGASTIESEEPAYQQITSPDHQTLVDLVKRVRRAVVTSGLPEDTKSDALRHLDEVDRQMSESAPDLSTMRDELMAARRVAGSATADGDSGMTVGELVGKAFDLAQAQYH